MLKSAAPRRAVPRAPRIDPDCSKARRRRLEKGLPLHIVAEAAGFNASWVSLVERHPGFMSENTRRRLAVALGCRPEDL